MSIKGQIREPFLRCNHQAKFKVKCFIQEKLSLNCLQWLIDTEHQSSI